MNDCKDSIKDSEFEGKYHDILETMINLVCIDNVVENI